MAAPADPYAHLPSQDIHVDDPTQAGYVTLMNWMHGRDVTRADGNLFRDIPITSDSTGFRRINLIHAGRPTVSLIIDERDVYLIAFRRGDGRWLHFWDRVLPKVPGPDGQPMEVIGVPIQLRSSYLQLMKEKEKAYFSVGKHVLVNIYFILLNYDTTVALDSPLMNKQRKALTQLLVMICEASQFNPIYDLVLDAMGKDESTPLYMGIWEWIKNWSTLSEFALHCKGGRIGCQRCCSGPWHGCASCYLFGGEWR